MQNAKLGVSATMKSIESGGNSILHFAFCIFRLKQIKTFSVSACYLICLVI